MNNILSNAQVQRTLPDWRAVQLAARVPIKILRQARDYHTNTSDEILYKMLDTIGIDAICDMVSQGCFVYDVSNTLDIPVIKFRLWLELDQVRIEKIERAEQLSAEAYLSVATNEVMSVEAHDTDAAKVAKTKAEHLKWLAKVKDRDKYSDRIDHKHTGGQTIEYRITMAPPPTQNIIDV